MKKHKGMIKFLAFLVVIIFLFSYFIEMSGYYTYNLQNKKNLTEEQMKRFEKDVEAGKEVDIYDYMEESRVDYSNNLTRTASNVSIKVNEYLKTFLKRGFKVLGKIVG